ncbi:MAG: YbaB/EbfC family nucleoid-associated protein [Planctomycetaceae bacterium]|nr:YbaB/EbfC family nucleoid-associated protein [Planctomycetaceae bacterium]
MFKGLSNLAGIMKQAQEFQSQMGEMQQQLKDLLVEGESGGGMVKVTANGQQEIVNCIIDGALFSSGDKELVEDLVVSATNAALAKAKEAAAEKMSQATQGLNLPGLDDLMKKFGG